MSHNSSSQLAQLPIDPKDRPKYSPAQMQKYFTRIELPAQYLPSPILKDPSLAKQKKDGLPFLEALQKHHLANIRFENLELHYSQHRKISLHMDDLYDKFVERGLKFGRGGRCMENNGFFGMALRSLGYDVRNCAGRVRRMMSPDQETRELQGQTYDGWNHMLILVRLDGEWYVVDVGMGAMGPNIVYLLQDGYECIAIPPRKIRLQKRSIAEHTASRLSDAPQLWCYDVCHHPNEPGKVDHWIPTYCFTETEFLPQDYEMMSRYTSTNPRSFFTYSVLCTKNLLDEAGEKVIGDITLFNNGVRKTVGGQREVVVKELKTEAERVKALKEVLDVELTEEEESGISPSMRLA